MNKKEINQNGYININSFEYGLKVNVDPFKPRPPKINPYKFVGALDYDDEENFVRYTLCE